ncbi:putative Mitochondrial carnitine/acylcarnitine carrier protein CACL [Glarea lozoyensis 74030]|uniref:Putative Mitochondrial carnitine/acylcarnitine carrier protein CACL n=1 Tax=Glarea lozoyensis (strain ATCC 74030 / MF5533) TaxID=1104152 RepID=H0ELA6_GLAL7|nr:putative Mitochondrial carnitine/acylcarnitine carrier protein CACL [Glarea lozoyensis 74030]
MSADFWAGYISGAAGILIGNPLDVIKVRLQAGTPVTTAPSSYTSQFSTAGSLIRGATAPILGYGALNALLFMTYNRSAIGGLATWVVSTPTELVKCRAQMSTSASTSSSWGITKDIIRAEGLRGLYFGGIVTALRDSIGYGFYFWSYELSTRSLKSRFGNETNSTAQEAAQVLLCGGLAGVITWASIFPLDMIKTRVQTQISVPQYAVEGEPLIASTPQRRLGAIEIAQNAYRVEGMGVFFRGLGVCSFRAFIVNAAQWAVYEWIMRELDPERRVVEKNV